MKRLAFTILATLLCAGPAFSQMNEERDLERSIAVQQAQIAQLKEEAESLNRTLSEALGKISSLESAKHGCYMTGIELGAKWSKCPKGGAYAFGFDPPKKGWVVELKGHWTRTAEPFWVCCR